MNASIITISAVALGLIVNTPVRSEELAYIRFVGETYQVRVEELKVDPQLFARMVADIQLAIGLNDRGGGAVEWTDTSDVIKIENFSGYPFILKLDRRSRHVYVSAALARAYYAAKTSTEVHTQVFETAREGVQLLNIWLATLRPDSHDLTKGVYSLSGRVDGRFSHAQLLGKEIVIFDYLVDYGILAAESPVREFPVVQVALRARGNKSFDDTRKSVLIFAEGTWKFMAP